LPALVYFGQIKTDLAVNGKQTKEKRLVMKEFSTEITYDEENLLSMSKENLRVVLEKRANDKIEREKQIALITSFAYRATLLALSVVPLKSMEKS
jgi:hypothetical protein